MIFSPRSGRQRHIIRLPPAPRAYFVLPRLFLGFRFASPQALCCHPRRGLLQRSIMRRESIGFYADSRKEFSSSLVALSTVRFASSNVLVALLNSTVMLCARRVASADVAPAF